MIYLDYAATTPMSDNALHIYTKAAKNAFGNSSSLHDIGEISAKTLHASRKIIGDSIGGSEKGVYFTSGGSEANIIAIQSLLNGLDSNKKHLITTVMEHSSLFTFFKRLESEGFEVTFLSPAQYGNISLSSVKKAIKSDTGLVSIQHGNSEIGSIQPIEEIGLFLKEMGIIFHSDCVQTFGKIPLNVTNIDAISISGHKIYGPKGIGAAYINPSIHWHPVIEGTTHESGFRPGTVDVPAVAAFATAANDIMTNRKDFYNHYQRLKNLFFDLLQPYNEKITVLNWDDKFHSLPNILPIMVKGIEGQYVMLECNRFGFAVSTGSACQVGMQAPPKSVVALGYSDQEAKQFIRASFGKDTTEEHIRRFTDVLIRIVENF
ncbi:IscS subfamily cysteine desulfurase [Metabacillus litoralis]|uniref:IscS subfamily cysteine desulfurase n=1 Tax=Metabacillus litoralis TaxID=152268 RepID=UPI002042205C|nr:IscS subfamily cysteine desulfurase [Metabacillus litoralis]